MKKVLILGGTNFIGRNLINALQNNKNIALTLFNRGITNPELFPKIEQIIGDRNTADIAKIGTTNWDYIIDLSCYYPNSLSEIIKRLKSPPENYIFISSCSAYDNTKCQSVLRDETAPILPCTEKEKTDTTNQTYGNRKAEAERVLTQSHLNYTIFRPALVYGKYDSTDRFYYWLHQIYSHKNLLLPEGGLRQFSLTYVDDLVAAIIKSLRPTQSNETYNAISSPQTTILQIVEKSAKLLGKRFSSLTVDADFLNTNNIDQWVDMPLWLNADYYTYDNSKIKSLLNLKKTYLNTGISEIIPYYESLNWPLPTYGISEAQRLELIKKAKAI